MPKPPYSKNQVDAAHATVERFLRTQGLDHLKTLTRGRHVVVYSEEPDGEKVPRIRFCALDHYQCRLDVTTHGRWEPTPYEGELSQLCDTVVKELSWLLAEF